MVLCWTHGLVMQPITPHRHGPRHHDVHPRPRMHTPAAHPTASKRTACAAGAFDGLSAGERLPDDCDAIDLQAIKRLEVCLAMALVLQRCVYTYIFSFPTSSTFTSNLKAPTIHPPTVRSPSTPPMVFIITTQARFASRSRSPTPTPADPTSSDPTSNDPSQSLEGFDLHQASPWDTKDVQVGVPWHNAEVLEFTDQELWDEVCHCGWW